MKILHLQYFLNFTEMKYPSKHLKCNTLFAIVVMMIGQQLFDSHDKCSHNAFNIPINYAAGVHHCGANAVLIVFFNRVSQMCLLITQVNYEIFLIIFNIIIIDGNNNYIRR